MSAESGPNLYLVTDQNAPAKDSIGAGGADGNNDKPRFAVIEGDGESSPIGESATLFDIPDGLPGNPGPPEGRKPTELIADKADDLKIVAKNVPEKVRNGAFRALSPVARRIILKTSLAIPEIQKHNPNYQTHGPR